jgi:two-component system response regulator YesN
MLKVLIVDDNESDREGLKDFIDWNSLGIGVVITAKNGQDGFEKAIEVVPDIILSDISMPVYDGIEMMKRIKKEIEGVSFLFMSLFSEVEYLQSAINLKAETYILKPIDIDSISVVILKMVHEKLRRDEKEKKEIDLLNQIKSNMPILQENLIKELFL